MADLDSIRLHNMIFFGYHGALEAEQLIGQRFMLDAVLYRDLQPAGQSDDLRDTVNYAEVYAIIKEHVEKRRYNLLEGLAEAIAQAILTQFSINKVEITVRKPSAPVAGIFDYVEISIAREKRQ